MSLFVRISGSRDTFVVDVGDCECGPTDEEGVRATLSTLRERHELVVRNSTAYPPLKLGLKPKEVLT
jgi:hypothetical protein